MRRHLYIATNRRHLARMRSAGYMITQRLFPPIRRRLNKYKWLFFSWFLSFGFGLFVDCFCKTCVVVDFYQVQHVRACYDLRFESFQTVRLDFFNPCRACHWLLLVYILPYCHLICPLFFVLVRCYYAIYLTDCQVVLCMPRIPWRCAFSYYAESIRFFVLFRFVFRFVPPTAHTIHDPHTIHTLNAHAPSTQYEYTHWTQPPHTYKLNTWPHNRKPSTNTHEHAPPANRQPWPPYTHTRTHKRTRDRCHGIGGIRDHQTPGRPLFRGDPGALERGKDIYLYTRTNCRRFDTIVKWKLPKNAQNKKYYV